MKLTKRMRKAFSMVELMLLLLFVSLITAALTPVVTKKHFKMPRPANHGAYMCYYDGNQLHEIRLSGKALSKVVFDRNVSQCKFDPPEKVSYFHVSAIGGGGGGGDSGYTGGTYTSLGPFTEQLDPIGITEYMVSTAQRDITRKDFQDFGGQIYGFVIGAGSGKGGDQLYAKRSDSYPCTINHRETYTTTTTYRRTSCTSWTTYTSTYYHSSDSSSGTSTSGSSHDSDRGSSSSSHTPGSTPSNPTTSDKGSHSVNHNDNSGYYNVKPNGSATSTGKQNPGQSGLNGGINVFLPKPGHSGSDSYILKDKKLRLDLPKFRFYNPNNEVAMLHPNNAFLFSINNDLLAYSYTYTYSRCTNYTTNYYTRSVVNYYTVCDKHQNYYSYSTATHTGGAGAGGAVCRSNIKHGGIGLVHEVVSMPAKGRDGNDCYPTYNLSPEYDSPHYSNSKTCFTCSGRPENGEAIAGNSTIKFGSSEQGIDTVNAQNSPRGGTAATCNSNGVAGTAGTQCSPAKVTEGCSPGRYGYCLKRWNSSTWEANTTYTFKFTYSQNYLQYGLPGLQGQYKTMVIRSFKDKDTAIIIGKGGAKGVDGGKGGDGQETIFGEIIRAKGGEGGEGGQTTAPEWLEGYREGATATREEGGVKPEKPQPDNASSNIMNFLAPQDSEKIAQIMETKRIGYGGQGGGSRHNCWLGEYRKWLDGGELEHSYEMPPASCTSDYETIPAEEGHAGAIIIRW